MTTEAGKVRRFVHMREGMVEVLQTYGNDAILIDFANRACNPSDMFFHKSDYEALEKRARELEAMLQSADEGADYRINRIIELESRALTMIELLEIAKDIAQDLRRHHQDFRDPLRNMIDSYILAIDAAMAAEGEENE
jgi:hypothetical protein